VKVIPIATLPALALEATLDDVPFRITLAFNYRGGYWTASFYNRDKTPIVEGIKVVVEYELLRQFPGRGMPPGQLLTFDADGSQKIGETELGTRFPVVYVPEDEVVEPESPVEAFVPEVIP
jgi:hypothetical protein